MDSSAASPVAHHRRAISTAAASSTTPRGRGGFGGSGGLPSSRSTPADLFAMGLRDGEQHSSHNSSRAEARRQALLKARFTRPEGLVDVLWVFILATVVKVLLIPSYRSTDFEVHRNWLALTHSLPMHEWYFESTSEWTLDYPPLFAYFEYGLSHVARFFDPAMLVVSNLNYASSMTVVFQRLSVIASDFVLMVGIIMWSKTWSRTRVTECAHSRGKFAIIAGLTFLNPGLLMVDHIHFQYNGMLLGLLLISLSLVRMEKNLRALCTFCALLLAKHIFFYVVPVFGVYLLGHYCWTVPSFVTSKQLRRCRRREKAEEDVKKKETGGEAQGYATSEDDDEREDEDDDSNMGGGSSSGPVHKTWDTTSRELRQRRRAEGFLSGSDGKRKELNVDKNEEKQENDEIDENDEDASPGLCCACCYKCCCKCCCNGPDDDKSKARRQRTLSEDINIHVSGHFQPMNFLALVAVSLAALIVAFGPILVSSILHDASTTQDSFTIADAIESVRKQMTQILSRLFPWQRGLCHAYWAPNIWAWYSAADRVLIRASRILKLPLLGNATVEAVSVGSTGGLVQVVSMVVLPNIKPAFTFFATIVSMGPILWKVSVGLI
jgi:hypothetical protein